MATFPWQIAFDEDRGKEIMYKERERQGVGVRVCGEWITKRKEIMIAHEGIVLGEMEEKKQRKISSHHARLVKSRRAAQRVV